MSTHTKIFVTGLEIQASIGIHPHEYESTQPIIVDVELDLGAMPAPDADRIHETFDYSLVADKVVEMAEEAHVQLVETLAHRIARWALDSDARILACHVKIAKPHALINAKAAGVEVHLIRDGDG